MGEFAREQVAQQVGDRLPAPERGDLDPAAQLGCHVDGEPRCEAHGIAVTRRGIRCLEDIPEVGWALMPEACGKGLATEALGAALAWADGNLQAERTGCIIDPGNAASLRLAGRLGFLEVARPEFLGKPIVLLHRPTSRA